MAWATAGCLPSTASGAWRWVTEQDSSCEMDGSNTTHCAGQTHSLPPADYNVMTQNTQVSTTSPADPSVHCSTPAGSGHWCTATCEELHKYEGRGGSQRAEPTHVRSKTPAGATSRRTLDRTRNTRYAVFYLTGKGVIVMSTALRRLVSKLPPYRRLHTKAKHGKFLYDYR